MPINADSTNKVLIVSADAMSASLLGGLVETLGYAVAFAAPGESSEATMKQLRPRVCMLDCGSTDACDDGMVARAIMRGVSVVLLGRQSHGNGWRDLAARHGVEMVFTPPEAGPLGDVLDRAIRRQNS